MGLLLEDVHLSEPEILDKSCTTVVRTNIRLSYLQSTTLATKQSHNVKVLINIRQISFKNELKINFLVEILNSDLCMNVPLSKKLLISLYKFIQ